MTIKEIEIQTIDLPADLEPGLAQHFSDQERINPQFGIAWANNLTLNALDQGDRAKILVAQRSVDDFVALPILLKKGRKALSLSTFYTSIYQPLVRSDDALPLFVALFKHLRRAERAAELILMPLDMASPANEQLMEAQAQAGWRGLHKYFCFGNWVHDMQGLDYSEYLASRPSRLRNTIRRKSSKFEAGEPGELRMIRTAEGLEDAIEQFNTVYNNSWKMNEPYPDFIPSLIRLAADRGWLRMGIATYNGIAVASQIWLVHNNAAYIYKLAYDENYKSLSPGTVLTAYMFEHVMDTDQVDRIDYLSGDDVYKRDWMSTRYEREGTAAYNASTLRGFSSLISYRLKRLLKKRGSNTRIE